MEDDEHPMSASFNVKKSKRVSLVVGNSTPNVHTNPPTPTHANDVMDQASLKKANMRYSQRSMSMARELDEKMHQKEEVDELTAQYAQHDEVASALTSFHGNVVKKMASRWHDKFAAAHRMISMDWNNLGQLCDTFERADETGAGGVDMREFSNAFRKVYPPWRTAVDSNVAVNVLNKLFTKIDANDDSRVSWEEFSSYVLQESMHITSKGASSMLGSVFAHRLPEDEYTDPSAYHRDMITGIRTALVEVGDETFVKYMTCGKDGTFRVWSSQTNRHIATVNVSTRSPPAWVTCCVPLPDLASRTNVAGVVAAFSLDRTVCIFDMKKFSKISEFSLGEDVFPMCCDAFSHTESVRGTVTQKNEIVVGDTSGRLLLYPQGPALLDTSFKLQPTVVQVHVDAVTQVSYIQGIDRLVSSSSDGTVCIVHPVNHQIRYFRGHEKGVQAFTFCEPNKYIASGGVERDIVLWNPYTMRRITSLRGHDSCIHAIDFNKRDNHIISLSVDKEVIVWDPKSFEMICRSKFNEIFRPENTFSAMMWDNHNGRLVLANTHLHVLPYRSETSGMGNVQHKSHVVSALVNGLFEMMVTVDHEGLILVWNIEDGRQMNAFSCDSNHSTKASCAKFDSTWRRLYIGSEDGQLRIFNWHNGVCINELLSDANTEITMIENASSTRRKYTLATGWNRILYVWKDPPEGYKQSLHAKIDPGFDCEITSIATYNPSEVAFGLYDGKSVIWESEGSWRKRLVMQTCTGTRQNHTQPPPEGMDLSQFVDEGENLASLAPPPPPAPDSFLAKDQKAISSLVYVQLRKPSKNKRYLASMPPVPASESGHLPLKGKHKPDNVGLLLVSTDMEGMVCAWDPQTGDKRGEFDAGHLDEYFQRDGSRKRLPVVSMAVQKFNECVITGDNQGHVRMHSLQDACLEKVDIRVTVHGAKQIIAADANGFSDPYCKVMLGCGLKGEEVANMEPESEYDFGGASRKGDNDGNRPIQTRKTATKEDTLDPEFEETFVFEIGFGSSVFGGGYKEIIRRVSNLHFAVNDFDRYGGHDELGHVNIDLNTLPVNTPVDQWYTLESSDDDRPYLECGHLHVTVEILVNPNQPVATFDWTAYEFDGVKSISIVTTSSPANHINGQVLTLSESGVAKLWSSTGSLIGTIGRGGWTKQHLLQAETEGVKKKASRLITSQVLGEDIIEMLNKKKQTEKLAKEKEEKEEKEDRKQRVERKRRLEVLEALLNGANNSDIERSVQAQIQDDAYQVLSRQVMDGLIARRGHLPEEHSLVFTRMHVEGQSQREYHLKESAIEMGNERLEDHGLLQKKRVQYEMCDVTKVEWVEHGDDAQVHHPSIDVRPAGTVADIYSRKDENSKGYEPFQASTSGRGGAGAGAGTRAGWKRGEDKTSQNASAAAASSSKPAPSATKAPSGGGSAGAGGEKNGGKFDESSSFSGNVLRLLKLNSPVMPKGSWEWMHAKDEEEEKKNKALEQAAAAAAAIDKLCGKGSPGSTSSPAATAGSPLKTIRIPRPKSRMFGAPRFDPMAYMKLYPPPPPAEIPKSPFRSSSPNSPPRGWTVAVPPGEAEVGSGWGLRRSLSTRRVAEAEFTNPHSPVRTDNVAGGTQRLDLSSSQPGRAAAHSSTSIVAYPTPAGRTPGVKEAQSNEGWATRSIERRENGAGSATKEIGVQPLNLERVLSFAGGGSSSGVGAAVSSARLSSKRSHIAKTPGTTGKGKAVFMTPREEIQLYGGQGGLSTMRPLTARSRIETTAAHREAEKEKDLGLWANFPEDSSRRPLTARRPKQDMTTPRSSLRVPGATSKAQPPHKVMGTASPAHPPSGMKPRATPSPRLLFTPVASPSQHRSRKF